MDNRNALFFAHANEYLHKYLPNQREMSMHTEKSYTDAMSLFRRYAFEVHGLPVDKLKFVHVDFDFVSGYAMWLKTAGDGKKGSSAQTCNLSVSAIRSYVRFAMSKDAGLASIWIQLKGIQPIKTTKPTKEILSENALKTMIGVSSKNGRLALRNSTLLVLMYDSACRISEILNLKMCDIILNVAQPHIFVTGKGRKERRIPLMDRTVTYLKEYISVFHGSGSDSDFLFYTVIKGVSGPLSQDCVSKVLKKTADNARIECQDIPDKIHAHILRRTRATHLYQSGYDIFWIARLLGHECIETTKEYLTPSMEQMRHALESSSLINNNAAVFNTEEYEQKRAKLYGIR